MSAGTKAGLVFLLPQFLVIICATILGFVPIVMLPGNLTGVIGCCFAPIAALLLAMPAGYFAAQWHPAQDEITGQAVTAGIVSGLGALLGSVLFWVSVGLLFRFFVDDAMLAQISRQMSALRPDLAMDLPALRRGLSFLLWITSAIGVVGGLLAVGFSLIGGLLGMAIARGGLPTDSSTPSV